MTIVTSTSSGLSLPSAGDMAVMEQGLRALAASLSTEVDVYTLVVGMRERGLAAIQIAAEFESMGFSQEKAFAAASVAAGLAQLGSEPRTVEAHAQNHPEKR